MKTKIIWVALLLIVSTLSAQDTHQEKNTNNFFRIGGQIGYGLGFNHIDLLDYDEVNGDNEVVSSGDSSISGGGGWHVSATGEYVINHKIGLGINMGYQSSHLRPILDDATVRFNRFTFLPTIKYLIALNPRKTNKINVGVGYGFYFGNKMKFDVGELGGEFNLDYNNAQGFNLITEYEETLRNGGVLTIGLRYYGVSYDIKELTGDNTFDELKGSGMDLYLGFSFPL
ncbi:hypothetical protein ABW636_07125 [Aquimarina sp. 2201CG1-2-11]|uniref:hypothetical protein n=1 Tax=Aquimarina discodermiae TaxID=3231043 RepID=UPI00346272C3